MAKKATALVWLLIIMSVAPTPTFAQGREATIAIITSPADGSTVSGQVVIMGSASHPSVFVGYEVEFDNMADANEIWLPIGTRVSQPITEGTLQIWDTVANNVADGVYQIRLRVFLNLPDEPPVEFVVQNVTVLNSVPTLLPTSLPPPATSTEGPPAPTAPIQQPPTNTPRPTVETLINSNNSSSSLSGETSSSSLNFDRLQGAFCSGAVIAGVFFALLGGYLAVRARLRPVARQIMWQIRSEIDDDRRG
ncbi:MAG: hypothetical protein HY862_19365 [Chloroflexi bacterium]|nr:hypothetical protein [Chloroflexota bacterium]